MFQTRPFRALLFILLTGFAGALMYPGHSGFEKENWKPVTIWATYYNTPLLKKSRHGIPLTGPDGKTRGPRLSPRDHARALMEGAFMLYDGAQTNVYNYIRRIKGRPVFAKSQGPYGDGVADYKLVPYRTIAVDPAFIPIGTVLYIPMANNLSLTLPDGSRIRHDGYFFAADRGGAVKGNHIDVFIGTREDNPFADWLTSRPDRPVEAYLVPDGEIRRRLEMQHRAY